MNKNTSENASENYLSLKRKIVEEIRNNKIITYNELSIRLNKDRATIRRNISNLKKQGKIKRIGPDKGGYWEVI